MKNVNVKKFDVLQPYFESWTQAKPPQTLLLTGPQGVGKWKAALTIAKWLNCKSPDRPCNACAWCVGAQAEQVIDLQILKDYKIDALKTLFETQGFGAFQERYKITLLKNAEQLTPQAANAALKIFEEPPNGWIFILTATDRSQLLPTIASRCFQIRIKPMDRNELRTRLLLEHAEIFSVDNKKMLEQILDWSQGCYERAVSLLDPKTYELRMRVDSYHPSTGLDRDLIKLLEESAESAEQFEMVLDGLEWRMLHDLQDSSNTGPLFQSEKWADFVAQIHEARKLLVTPINRKILSQTVLFKLLA